MSNYHILSMHEKGNKIDVVFHLPIPDEDNAMNVNYRTAVSQWKPFTESKVPWITSGTEFDALGAGELYEHKETITLDGNMTNLEKRGEIDNRFTSLSATVVDKVKSQLKFWGLNRDVPT